MELEQIAKDLAVKDMIQEVRTIGAESEKAKERAKNVEDAVSQDKDTRGKIAKMRPDTVYRSALSYGTQSGLAWQSDRINTLIDTKYQGVLDTISFIPFIEDGVILVPSVLERRAERVLKDGKLIEINASFYIDEEAELVMGPVTYRDYLKLDFEKPDELHPVLMPRNEEEAVLWDKGINEGWQLGIEQANEIFFDGFAEMEKDITGRVNYLKLKSLNMLGEAKLKVTDHGMTFNGRTMNVGETIYTITSPVIYQSLENWRSAWQVGMEVDDD